VPARQATVQSTAICREALTTLRQVFVREGPDEPDLGLNIAYVTACASLRRLRDADPWEVSGEAAQTIRHRLSEVVAIDDPEELDAQLLSVPAWVLRLLDRRRPSSQQTSELVLSRRAGDRIRRLTGKELRARTRS